MSSFIEIIQKCLSPNNTIRIEGESEIQEKSNINLYESLTECTNIMTDDNGKKEIRQQRNEIPSLSRLKRTKSCLMKWGSKSLPLF
jgi:hypothetical protein